MRGYRPTGISDPEAVFDPAWTGRQSAGLSSAPKKHSNPSTALDCLPCLQLHTLIPGSESIHSMADITHTSQRAAVSIHGDRNVA